MPDREITDHHDGNGLLDKMHVYATDDGGPGGAAHTYKINGPDDIRHLILFQRGPCNGDDSQAGILDPVLLAIIIDRLRCFQAGQYSTRENAIALTHLETALLWMHQRSNKRAKRGVLGTNKP